MVHQSLTARSTSHHPIFCLPKQQEQEEAQKQQQKQEGEEDGGEEEEELGENMATEYEQASTYRYSTVRLLVVPQSHSVRNKTAAYPPSPTLILWVS